MAEQGSIEGTAMGDAGQTPLFLPSHTSMLPNQSIVTPPPPSHYLSAADDLIDRFQLYDSYRVLLEPFRKDIRSSGSGAANAAQSGPATPSATTPASKEPSNTSGQTHFLPKTYSHFLPPSLPGKVRPTKPPRSRVLQARRLATQAAADDNPALDKKEKAMARAAADWDKVSTTLRKAVMKPEYTAADIRPLDDDAIRGYIVEAGEVPEIDRSLLEADVPGGSPPRKKKKKNAKSN